MLNLYKYVLINCGLIHKFLIKKEDIKKLEDETFYTVEIIRDLNDSVVENKDDNLILSNGSETFKFKRVDTDKYLKYMLDEF